MRGSSPRMTSYAIGQICSPDGAQLNPGPRDLFPDFASLHPGYEAAMSGRPCQRAVDHRDRVRQAVDRDKGAEARAFFLAEQDQVEHVEPVERNARPAILALLHWVEERLATADLVDHVLDVFGRGS